MVATARRWVADDILTTRLAHLTAGELDHISRTAEI